MEIQSRYNPYVYIYICMYIMFPYPLLTNNKNTRTPVTSTTAATATAATAATPTAATSITVTLPNDKTSVLHHAALRRPCGIGGGGGCDFHTFAISSYQHCQDD